jgi:WD40 repeat protein
MLKGDTYEPLVYGHAAHAWTAAWHPRSHHLVATGADDGTVCLWNAQLRQLIARCSLDGNHSKSSSTESRHLKLVATSARGRGQVAGARMDLNTDGQSGREVCVRSVAFSPDGRHLAVGVVDGTLMVLMMECGSKPPMSEEVRFYRDIWTYCLSALMSCELVLNSARFM